MRTIIAESDFDKIRGRFVIELTHSQSEIDITETDNPGFWMEKRIMFISRDDSFNSPPEHTVQMVGFYYNRTPRSLSEFVNHFNGLQKDGVTDRGRFLRLLNDKELQWLALQMIEMNK